LKYPFHTLCVIPLWVIDFKEKVGEREREEEEEKEIIGK